MTKRQYEEPKLEMIAASIGMSLTVSGNAQDTPIDDPWIKM